MAYALVGSAGTVASGTSSVAPSFGQATSAGNLLICWVGGLGGAPTTTASGWNQAVVNGAEIAIWYKANSAASETAPTFTGSTSAMNAMLAEFSGGATSSPLDQTGGTLGGATPVTVTAAAADAASGELVIVAQYDDLTKAGTVTTSHTYNNGATANINANNDATSTTPHYRFSYGLTTGNSSADNCSAADNSMNLSTIRPVIASFLLASGAAAPIPDVGLALTVT